MLNSVLSVNWCHGAWRQATVLGFSLSCHKHHTGAPVPHHDMRAGLLVLWTPSCCGS